MLARSVALLNIQCCEIGTFRQRLNGGLLVLDLFDDFLSDFRNDSDDGGF